MTEHTWVCVCDWLEEEMTVILSYMIGYDEKGSETFSIELFIDSFFFSYRSTRLSIDIYC